jgi:hypothetical protein
LSATEEGIGPLNLSDADLTEFSYDLIPAGTKVRAEVFDIDETSITKDDGKLPQGTPGYNVHFKVLNTGEGSKWYNKRVFNRYWIPGEGYDKEKAAKMRGMFVNFLIALGYTKEEVMGGSFAVDRDDIQGRELFIVVGKKAAQKDSDGNEIYPAQNTIVGTKSLADVGAAETSTLL